MAQILRKLADRLDAGRGDLPLEDAGDIRLREFAETSADWFWEMDQDLRFTYLSDRFTELTGIDVQDMIGKCASEVLDQTGQQVNKSYFAFLETHRPFRNIEYPRYMADGSTIYLSVSGAPMFDDDGHFTGYQGIGVDISDKRYVTEALRESELRFRSLFDYGGIGMTLTNLKGEFLNANNAFCSFVGYSLADLANSTGLEITHPDDKQATVSKRREVVEGGGSGWLEKRFIRSDGEVIWGKVTWSVIPDENGNPEFVIGYVQDFGEQKESENRYRTLFENASEGIAISTVDDHICVDCNEAFATTVGYAREELVNHSILKCSTTRTVEERTRLIENFKYGKNHIVEGFQRHKDGRNIPVEIHASLIDYRGKPHVLAFSRDISLRKKAEQALQAAHDELEERVKQRTETLRQEVERRKEIEKGLVDAIRSATTANRAKSEFLANMSHELRTPLNAIIGFSHVLADQVFGDLNEKQREYIGNVADSGHHLLDLINNILDVSAIEADRLNLSQEAIDVPSILDASIVMVRSRADEGGINIVNGLETVRLRAQADELRLKQIFVNLLTNSIKFTEAGGSITVMVQRTEKDTVTLYFTDTGAGMTAEEIKIALEPFGQVNRGQMSAQQGTGLGLPLTQRLIEAHGWDMQIESVPGRGTTVSIELLPDHIEDFHDAAVPAGSGTVDEATTP